MDVVHLWVVCIAVSFYYKVDVSAECVDKISKSFPLDIINKDNEVIGTVYNCKTLFRVYPDVCERVGGEDGACCKTCGDHTCLDKLGPYSPYIVQQTVFTTCKKLIKKHRFLCKTLSGNYGQCCRTCKNVDTSCVDELIQIGGMGCKAFVKEDKCRCADEPAKTSCCATCQNKNLQECNCRDFVSKEFPVQVDIKDIDNNPIVQKDVDNCKEIVMYYAEFCKPLGREGAACCKSCQGVDPECYDNLSWKITMKLKNKECNSCNCHQLERKGQKFLKLACKNDLVGDNINLTAKQACCLQCSRVGLK